MRITIFLCKECQLNHRSYGVSISYIRSIELDNWKDEHIALLKLGGNERIKDLMVTYNINPDTNKFTLYNSKLFDYYRKLLKAESRGDQRPKPPSDEEALNLIESKKSFQNKNSIELENKNICSNENINIVCDDSSKDLKSQLNSYVSSIWNITSETTSKIKNQIQYIIFLT